MQAVAEARWPRVAASSGVIPTVLGRPRSRAPRPHELHITDTMHTRKALIGERSDAFIALPGGFAPSKSCSRCSPGRR